MRRIKIKKKGKKMILKRYINDYDNCQKFGFRRKRNAERCLKSRKYPLFLELGGIIELNGFYFVKIRNSQNYGGISVLGKGNHCINVI